MKFHISTLDDNRSGSTYARKEDLLHELSIMIYYCIENGGSFMDIIVNSDAKCYYAPCEENKKIYAVVGCYKYFNIHIKYGMYSMKELAFMKFEELSEELDLGILFKNYNGKPIDNIVVYENYGKNDQRIIRIKGIEMKA